MIQALKVIEDLLAGIALLLCFGLVCFEMMSRALIGYSLIWSEELSRYLLIWMTYLGAAGAAREGLHIRVECVVHLLNERVKTILEFVSNILCSGFSIAMVVFGLRLVKDTYKFGLMSADSTLSVPIWCFQLAIPVGFLIIAIRLMIKMFVYSSCGRIESVS